MEKQVKRSLVGSGSRLDCESYDNNIVVLVESPSNIVAGKVQCFYHLFREAFRISE